jgi:membrane-bound lytic murein transglycosylase B
MAGAGVSHAGPGAPLYSDREEVRAFVTELADKHELNEAELLGMFRRAEPQQAVLDAISRPAEKALTWAQYRPIFITESRARGGVEFWREHADILEKAEAEYGVPPQVITAIIGVETRYGRHRGSYPVFDSLITLGFDAPRRQNFFRSELEQFLLLARDEQFDPFAVKGSYAGAMGIPQFISSSYRHYAVDFDGDGRRDLIDNPADAIGSVANYFKRHGWKNGRPVAVEAVLEDESARELAVGRGRGGLKPERTVAGFRRAGVVVDSALPDEAPATLIRLEGSEGDEYWLGLKNFYVITRYNISAMYAMAVYQLSNEIKSLYQQAPGAAADTTGQ